MRLLLRHDSLYRYPEPAALGPHTVRLRPASHTKATIETYSLRVEPAGEIRWQRDPQGNDVARVTFPEGALVQQFAVSVELAVDIRPVNPFDFFLDDRAKNAPFDYPDEMRPDLAPFLARGEGGPLVSAFLEKLPRSGDTIALLVELNQAVNGAIRYVIREEPGIFTPEQTLSEGRGSCRDSAVLLLEALRSRGLAARFASGYLIQLTDEGMIPNQPKGVGRDVVDLHAWVEVYLPGGGWIGLDATSGLFCGEGHIPLACSANPAFAGPIEGTSGVRAEVMTFEMRVGRLGHEPRPTNPFEAEVYEALLAQGDEADRRLEASGVALTMGGEPTFNARDHAEAPEWNGDALGATKSALGKQLAETLRDRLAAGGILLHRSGKQYPGESLPRWALDIVSRRDGTALFRRAEPEQLRERSDLEGARRFAEAIATRLGVDAGFLRAGFEDPWRFLQEEASLPVDVDPLKADLKDSEERRRLARVLDRGLGAGVGFALPLARRETKWVSADWSFRRQRLYLVPGDSPMGLRLPLGSLPFSEPIVPLEAKLAVPDPRTAPDESEQARLVAREAAARLEAVRTALCVEVRDERLHVFLPPLASADDFIELLGTIDDVRFELGLDVQLEGYPPPPSSKLDRFAVTPDPGVLEVNLPPRSSVRAYDELIRVVFEAALATGLHSEKYLVDGRMAGSGGGHHLTFGGPTPLESPFVRRPDMLASLITFTQHHPSLSFLFTGLFVGPTSQAPRVDEARHDSLYELEIAMAKAFERAPDPPPFLGDTLFRHLLVDVAGNTHRAEICIDKLFAPSSVYGRQGIVELRAFEMPPHPKMVVAQALLVRALIATFAEKNYEGRLVRWGQRLHDEFLLPHFLWRDFQDVLAFLAASGLPLPEAAYRPFIELRCPVVGKLQLGDVSVSIRNAIEPWHVLGEEPTASGTSRFVDSSVERIEITVDGWVEERHELLVSGQALPLRRTGRAGALVGGVRFRAWAPPHSLQAHLGIHHPVRIDVVDTWGKRSLGACAYHVWHPEGRAYDAPPLTRFEAAARRAQRFTLEGPLAYPAIAAPTRAHDDQPVTLDLRRYAIDRPPPEPDAEPS